MTEELTPEMRRAVDAVAQTVAAQATIMAFLARAMVDAGIVTKHGLHAYLDTATRAVEPRYTEAGKAALEGFRTALNQALAD